MVGRGVNDARVFNTLLQIGGHKRAVPENLGKAQDRVQGRAQLVAHVGQQPVLQRFLEPRLLLRVFELRGEVDGRTARTKGGDQGAIAGRRGPPAFDLGEHVSVRAALEQPHGRRLRALVIRRRLQDVEKTGAVVLVQAIDETVTHEFVGRRRELRQPIAIDRRHPAVDAVVGDEIAGERKQRAALINVAGSAAWSRTADRHHRAHCGGEREGRGPFRLQGRDASCRRRDARRAKGG